ncbi:MAG: alpha-glucan family phosphorylase [Pseudomonadales bacterium]|nr:alpha-glucan family phosphorylase [Candidatus Woesebacteria bacterium]MCB9802251.1 alpha-glucan family phosphorylase [Pseudomonadales bacterium]
MLFLRVLTIAEAKTNTQERMSSPSISPAHPVAYLCAEYALSDALPWYAGGLGVLAGDTLKQADDEQYPMIGIGLLYRGKNALQHVDETGMQYETDDAYDPLQRGLQHVYDAQGDPLFITVQLGELPVWLRVWQYILPNSLPLYLLDTNTDQNPLEVRSLTEELYAGSDTLQLQKQIILGVGGVRLLEELRITPSVYHCNEGRPIFAVWELLARYTEREEMSFADAVALVRSQVVYTNHTLVAAGNKQYDLPKVESLALPYAERADVSVQELVSLGVPGDQDSFSPTVMALNTSRAANGVCMLHTAISEKTWPDYNWVAITNGVHMPTWKDTRIRADQSDQELWDAHLQLKRETVEYIQQKTGYRYNPEWLVVSWARRLASYKQPELLFSDVERLRAILTNAERPVMLLMSGKAHQGDRAGKELLQTIIGYMRDTLPGHALYIPGYSLGVAKMLVTGSDVWLNTPVFGLEACGTSGMKAAANGVIQASVADGWVAEVDLTTAGWVLDHTDLQASLYTTLEDVIAPLYYQRDGAGVPTEWLARMRESMKIGEQFGTDRMLEQYKTHFYTPHD